MKTLLIILVTLAAAVGFAMLALQDPGYVLLSRTPYTVRLPLALLVLLVLLAFAALILLGNLLTGILGAPSKTRAWWRRRHQARAQQHTMHGYAGLIEGNWSAAEQKLLSKLEHHQSPLLNYLGAAYAAHQQGGSRRRDHYLAAALEHHPQQHVAINLTAARLHYQCGEIVEARQVLETLRRRAPRNVAVARLLANVYQELRDWNSLLTLLPALQRLKAFPPQEQSARSKSAYEGYLSSPALLHGGGAPPTVAFNALPASRKKDPDIIAAYARQLLKVGEHRLAEQKLRATLSKKWAAELAYLYGKTETSFTDQQIKFVKSWAQRYGSHADLTLTLARLYRRAGQLEPARDLLSQVIANGGRAEARVDFGSLLEEIGDTEGALICYRQGMAAQTARLEAIASAANDSPPVALKVAESAEDGSAEQSVGRSIMPVVH